MDTDDECQPVVCGNCLTRPDRDFERDGEPWAACVGCGREDRLADIRQEAAEHLAIKSFNEALTRVADLSDTAPAGAPERTYRWIAL